MPRQAIRRVNSLAVSTGADPTGKRATTNKVYPVINTGYTFYERLEPRFLTLRAGHMLHMPPRGRVSIMCIKGERVTERF
jgi:hypothetical protein